jgi:hypothetical protein
MWHRSGRASLRQHFISGPAVCAILRKTPPASPPIAKKNGAPACKNNETFAVALTAAVPTLRLRKARLAVGCRSTPAAVAIEYSMLSRTRLLVFGFLRFLRSIFFQYVYGAKQTFRLVRPARIVDRRISEISVCQSATNAPALTATLHALSRPSPSAPSERPNLFCDHEVFANPAGVSQPVGAPFPAEPMRMWPISTKVNKPENDDPSVVEPVELTAATA